MFDNTNFGRVDLDSLKQPKARGLKPVRVLDVILDNSHPEYDKYGREAAIGAIKYSYVESPTNPDPQANPVAFPLNNSVRQYPLKNEIVLLSIGTSEKISLPGSTTKTYKKTYYTDIISVWNAANHNGINLEETPEIDLGEGIDEIDDISSLQPFPGDTILQGRLGQSIRLSGYPHPRNNIQVDSDTVKPNILFSVGHSQEGIENGFKVENINEDLTSVYLLSEHKVELQQSRIKFDSFKTTKPLLTDQYLGSQFLINSDRIILNSKLEDIILTSKENIGLSSNNIGIDAVENIGLDSKKIYLGNRAHNENQPVIKGDELESLLQRLLNKIEAIGRVMGTATTVNGQPIPVLNLEGPSITTEIRALKTLINPGGQSRLKSKKVFTE